MSDVHAAAVNGSELAHLLADARKRTLDLVADLDDRQMIGPKLAIVNPPLWEIGHIAWFPEFWTLSPVRGGRPLGSGRRGDCRLVGCLSHPRGCGRWVPAPVSRSSGRSAMSGAGVRWSKAPIPF